MQPPTDRDWTTFHRALKLATETIGVAVPLPHAAAMYAHLQLVIEANRRFNLTRITGPAEAAVKHYADSLALLGCDWIDPNSNLHVCDVGTGAGYPAVPLAIRCSRWQVAAIDGTAKKARFVAESSSRLGLTNVEAVHARAEAWAGLRSFNLVLLRAVTQIARGLREAGPLLRPGATVVFYKTGNLGGEELEAGRDAAVELNLEPLPIVDLELPLYDETLRRRLVAFRKPAPQSGH